MYELTALVYQHFSVIGRWLGVIETGTSDIDREEVVP